ncbi:MAG: hypothetical protein V2A58_00175 [Planctomycetota bacterium]
MKRAFVAALLLAVLVSPFCALFAQESADPEEAPQTQPEPATPATQASAETVREVVKCDLRRLYIGEITNFSAPACIEAKTVFVEIQWYQLAKRTTEKGTARYWIYMTKANKVFKTALRLYTKSEGKDLVCEKNTLVIAVYLKPSQDASPEEQAKQKVLVGYYAIPEVTTALLPFLNPSEGIE